jgi:2-amino-4-hydroxy-6-hydroxymethyldihydropteridine diphosphokinase
VEINSSSTLESHVAYISVGSNLGNKLENCQKGIQSLVDSGAAHLIAQSRIYATEPTDYTDQDWFINYVVKIKTSFEPLQLLDQFNVRQGE